MSTAGLVVQFVSAFVIGEAFTVSPAGTMFGYYPPMMGQSWHGPLLFTWMSSTYWVTIAVVLALGVLGVVWMNSTHADRLVVGSLLVLVAALLALPTMWGFGVGSVLMLVGSILGLTSSQDLTHEL